MPFVVQLTPPQASPAASPVPPGPVTAGPVSTGHEPSRHEPSRPDPIVVDADEHRVEGAWHVFRRTTTVMGRPRTVVALRLPVAGVRTVSPA